MVHDDSAERSYRIPLKVETAVGLSTKGYVGIRRRWIHFREHGNNVESTCSVWITVSTALSGESSVQNCRVFHILIMSIPVGFQHQTPTASPSPVVSLLMHPLRLDPSGSWPNHLSALLRYLNGIDGRIKLAPPILAQLSNTGRVSICHTRCRRAYSE